MATIYLPPTRNPYFRDTDGYITRTKLEDEVLNETVDFTQELGSETLSTATWTDTSGPTITGTTVASPLVTFTITKSGEATLIVTTSGSRTLHRRLRWLPLDTTQYSDYR